MKSPEVEVLWRDNVEHLSIGAPPADVPEGRLGLRITLLRRVPVFFDDEEANLIWSADGRMAFGQFDLTNRIGYHRIDFRIGAERYHFDFRTSSAKATWEEVREMARQISENVYSYQRQFQYSLPDGSRHHVPLPEVEYGWLRDRAPEICTLSEDIARRPGTQPRQRIVTSFRGQRVAVAQTLAHLRENPKLLEEGAGGPFVVGGTALWPSSVRVRVHEREPAAQEHEQLAHFLRVLAASCNRLEKEVPEAIQEKVRSWAVRIGNVRQLPLIRRHDRPHLRSAWSPVPTILQKADSRYRRVRSLQAEYMMDVAPRDTGFDAVRTNVKDAWEIYQAFAAHIVGQTLGLQYISKRRDLRERDSFGRSMIAGSMALYYDARPPIDVLPSWRDCTDRPARERPDIILVNHDTEKVVVLDAKFRTEMDTGRANSADLQEMQAYMQSFGISKGGIVFPGAGEPRFLSALGNVLIEMPLRPSSENHELSCETVRGVIDHLWANTLHQ